MGFSRQEYWSGLPLHSPGDLPDPGIKPSSSALQADALPSEPPGKPQLRTPFISPETFQPCAYRPTSLFPVFTLGSNNSNAVLPQERLNVLCKCLLPLCFPPYCHLSVTLLSACKFLSALHSGLCQHLGLSHLWHQAVGLKTRQPHLLKLCAK